MDSTPEDEGKWFSCIFSPFLHHRQGLDSLGCCNSFDALAWNILDEVATILVGFLWHGILILFLLQFHVCECFYLFMIHFTLIMFDFQGVISKIHLCMLCFWKIIIDCFISSV